MERQQDGCGDGFHEFECHLKALEPSPSRADRSAFMFRAGQASAQSQVRRMRRQVSGLAAASVLFAATTLGLAWQAYREESAGLGQRIRIVEKQVDPNIDEPHGARDKREGLAWMHPGAANIDSVDSLASAGPPANHYVYQRRLVMAAGLDAWMSPRLDGRLDLNEMSSYRELRASTRELQPPGRPDIKTKATNDQDEQGDRT